jgi:hypothetical protein
MRLTNEGALSRGARMTGALSQSLANTGALSRGVHLAGPLDQALANAGALTVTSPFSPQPLAYWRFESLAGGQLTDSASGGANPLTVTGSAATIISGQLGNALSIAAAAYSITSPSIFSGTQNWTVGLWLNLDTQPPAVNGNVIFTTSSGAGAFELGVKGSGSGFKLCRWFGSTFGSELALNTWHFVGIRINTSNELSYSVNGAAWTIGLTGLGWGVGSLIFGTSGQAIHGLDEPAVWHSALSDAEIAAAYARIQSTPYTN